MKTQLRRFAIALVIAALMLSSAPVAQEAQPASWAWLYDAQTVDVPGAFSTVLSGINNLADIVGHTLMIEEGTPQSFILSQGVVTPIEYPNATFTLATDVNDARDVVGTIQVPAQWPLSGPFGFVYRNGSFSFAPVNDTGTTGVFGINNLGTFVGYFDRIVFGLPTLRMGCVWGQHVAFSGCLENSVYSRFLAINDAGDLLFQSDYLNTSGLWSGNVITPISFPEVGTSSTLADLNNSRTIVGKYTFFQVPGEPPTHGFLYSRGRYRTMDIPGASSTAINGISDNGYIVGHYSTEPFGGPTHGFVATPRSPVRVTVNGADGPVTINRALPLEVHLQLDLGPLTTLPDAEVYIGVIAPSGVFWLNTEGSAFTSQQAPVFAGAVPSFAPSRLIAMPHGGTLQAGDWYWFMIVDDDSDGVPHGVAFDVAKMIVP